MYKDILRPAWVEINLAALSHNLKEIRKLTPDKKIIGVVKADAYGHGAIKVSDVLKDNGINSFAVATVPEAIALRNHFEESRESYDDYAYDITAIDISLDEEDLNVSGLNGFELPEEEREEILILGLCADAYAEHIVSYDLTPVLCDYGNARAFSNAACIQGKEVSVLIAIDTGMGRIGYVIPDPAPEKLQAEAVSDIISEIRKISELPNLRIVGILSHMSTADEKDKTFSNNQTAKYEMFCEALKTSGIFAPEGCASSDLPPFPYLTLANSAGIMDLENTYFDAVRPGIVLYGCYPSEEVDKTALDLKPVMSVKATVKHVKDVPADFSVGYGRKFISDRPSRIATIGIGYADGYSRRYSTTAKEPCVLIHGQFAPLAGKICMDQVMIDVTDIPDVKVGDEVVIMGEVPSNEDSEKMLSITADEIAATIGTINYEILCGFALRLPKIYKYFK